MTRDVDILIVNYNTRDDVDRCLASLHAPRQSRPHGIIVIDNGSSDGSVAHIRRRWPAVDVIPLDRNAGFAAANNVGFRRTTAPLVLLLNSDTLVPIGAVDRLVERLEARRAVAAGPRLVDAAGRPEVSFGRMLSPWTEAVQRLRQRRAARRGRIARLLTRRLVSRERFVDWVTGACLLVRRDAAFGAGLLDERFFMYEEDVDFCAALRARGGRVLFTPRSEVVHLRGRSMARAGRALRGVYDASHLAFYQKHAPHWVGLLGWWKKHT
jgi:GT2 family glycosyltransferase